MSLKARGQQRIGLGYHIRLSQKIALYGLLRSYHSRSRQAIQDSRFASVALSVEAVPRGMEGPIATACE